MNKDLYYAPDEAHELRLRAMRFRDLSCASVPYSELPDVQAAWADLAELLWPGADLTMDAVIVPHEQLAFFGEGWL